MKKIRELRRHEKTVRSIRNHAPVLKGNTLKWYHVGEKRFKRMVAYLNSPEGWHESSGWPLPWLRGYGIRAFSPLHKPCNGHGWLLQHYYAENGELKLGVDCKECESQGFASFVVVRPRFR